MNELLDRMDGRPVHHLHSGRDDPGCDNPAHAFAGVLGGCKPHQHGAGALRALENAHGNLGDNAEQALRAGDDAEKIVAAGIEMLAA